MATFDLVLDDTPPEIYTISGVHVASRIYPLVFDGPIAFFAPIRILTAHAINSNTIRVFFSESPAFRGRQSTHSADNPENFEVVDDLGLVLGVGQVENPLAWPDQDPEFPKMFSVDIRTNRHILWDRSYTVTVAGTLTNRDRTALIAVPPNNQAEVRGILKPKNIRETAAHAARE